MAETKWTPGSWTAEPVYGDQQIIGVYCDDATGSIVSQVGGFRYAPRTYSEIWANAHLIAVAPELYEALDKMTSIAAGLAAILHGKNAEDAPIAEFMDREYPSIRASINLLAKARGEA